MNEAAPGTQSAAGAVARLRHTFDSGRTRPLEWRLAQLTALRDLLDNEADRLADALAADLGKPTLEGWVTDVAFTRRTVAHTLEHLPSWVKPEKVDVPAVLRPGRAHLHRDPLGVVAVIAPWNYPVQLVVEPLAAAIAGGNTVLVKPSEFAPATAVALSELFSRHLDTDAVVTIQGDADVAAEVVAADLDHIFFTGSPRVGRMVMAAAAERLTPVTLELGGKSPAVVTRGADLAVAARRITWGKFLNAGQTCVAPDHVIVDRSLRDELVDGIVGSIRRFYGRNAAESPDYARIVNKDHLARLTGLLAAPESGEIVHGGAVSAADRYVEPTVFVDPDPGSALMSEEIFGPILPVVTVDDTQAAIAEVRSRPHPLALYVFADDETARTVIDGTASGGVCVNHTLVHAAIPDLGFGGVGGSGFGRYHGRFGFETFTNPRGVLSKPARPDPGFAYPPYGRVTSRVLRRIL
ncbi:MAG: aldehyde dehydrogenase family protein [Acidimicrobiales bacterium]